MLRLLLPSAALGHPVRPHRLRRRGRLADGFTLKELVIALSIAIILGAIAFPTASMLRANIAAAAAETNLRAVASAQESYHNSRGTFATSGNALNTVSGRDVSVVNATTASDGPDSVSVADLDSDTNRDLVGLAVKTDEGDCLTLRVDAPPQEQFEVVTVEAADGCVGPLAGVEVSESP